MGQVTKLSETHFSSMQTRDPNNHLTELLRRSEEIVQLEINSRSTYKVLDEDQALPEDYFLAKNKSYTIHNHFLIQQRFAVHLLCARNSAGS